MLQFHLVMLDAGVGPRTAQHQHVAQPPKHSLDLMIGRHRDDRLRACLGGAADIVGQRARHFDLQPRDVTNGDSKQTAEKHDAPEIRWIQEGKAVKRMELSIQKHQRNEEKRGVEVVVELKTPYIVVHHRQHFLCVYCVERDAETRQHPKDHAQVGQVPRAPLLVHTHHKATNDNGATKYRFNRRPLTKNDIGAYLQQQ